MKKYIYLALSLVALTACSLDKDPISDFNEEDLEFMKLLSKPITKHDVMCKIYEAMTEESISPLALQQSNKYTMILAFYEEMIRRMEYFGFLEVDETQFN